METIGERIKARRLEIQLSRRTLADALGVTYETVRQWEAGIAEPRPKLYRELSKQLQADEAQIVFGITSGLLAGAVASGLNTEKERLSREIAQLSNRDQLELLAEIADRLKKQ